MALNLPSLETEIGLTLNNVYCYNAGIHMDVSQGTGRVVLNMHPSINDWQKPPVDQKEISFGQLLVAANPNADPPVAEVSVITLEELMTETTPIGDTGITFAQAYDAIGKRLYQEWLKHPLLSGSTII